MSATEQELRQQLAACYRIYDYMGWSEMIYNHITVKLPGESEHFQLTPTVCTTRKLKPQI